MNRVALSLVLAALSFASALQADHTMHPTGSASRPFESNRLGGVHHVVSTTNAEAQRWFDQGLALCFAFNHEEAVRSFEHAAALDPKLAMAHWGIALALGPNINLPVDREREVRAAREIDSALALLAAASESDRAYVQALAKRYSADTSADLHALDGAYRNAMRAVAKRFPDDLDAQTLYAESIMDLTPWQYWTADGKPAADTDELLAALEGVLRRNPDHVGANHYYIHAVEASPHPERALPCAERLKTLAPDAGHLVHMPSHIWIRTGDYAEAAAINEHAARLDSGYIARHQVEGVYPVMYYTHNLHFAAVAHDAQGRPTDALRYARRVSKSAEAMARIMPMVEPFVPTTALILVHSRRWKDVLALPRPAADLPVTNLVFRFARGMALAHTRQPRLAQVELDSLLEAEARVPKDAIYGTNVAGDVVPIPRMLLRAAIANANGDGRTALEFGKQAVAAYDALHYDEPEDWYLNPRETLGGLLLEQASFADAEEVFRADLGHRPRNGRALFGLALALEGQNKPAAAALVRAEYQRAWRHAEKPLVLADLP